MATKKCPFCAEEIQAEAIKCKHCGEYLLPSKREQQKTPWYFKTSILIGALLTVGPLALPLLWFNPRYTRNAKIIWTCVIVLLSYALGAVASKALNSLMQYYKIGFQGL